MQLVRDILTVCAIFVWCDGCGNVAQIEKANQNYQVVWGIKSSHEDKLNVAAEQKRVLVKEVKALRKKTDELATQAVSLQEVNSKLEEAVLVLQAEMERKQKEFDSKLEAAVAASKAQGLSEVAATGDSDTLNSSKTTEVTNASDSSLNQAIEAMRMSAEVKKMGNKSSGSALSVGVADIIDDVSSMPSPGKSPAVFQGPSGTSSVLPPPPSQVDPEGNAIDWDAANRSSLLNLDWLSPQQRQLVEERRKDELVLGQEHERKKSLIDFTSSLFSHDKDKEEDPPPPAPEGESKISLRRLSAMFHKGTDASTSHHQSESRKETPESPLVTPHATVTSPQSGVVEGSALAVAAPVSSPASPGDVKPRCFRCGGTVEGPKYSTCKCDIPLMAPEEGTGGGAMDSFKGFLSKGKKSAGGFADGFKKAGSIFSHKSGDDDNSVHSGGTATRPAGNSSPAPTVGSSEVPTQPSSESSTNWLDSIAHELRMDSTPSVGTSKKSSLLSLDPEDTPAAPDYETATALLAMSRDRPAVSGNEPDSDDDESSLNRTADEDKHVNLARKLRSERN